MVVFPSKTKKEIEFSFFCLFCGPEVWQCQCLKRRPDPVRREDGVSRLPIFFSALFFSGTAATCPLPSFPSKVLDVVARPSATEEASLPPKKRRRKREKLFFLFFLLPPFSCTLLLLHACGRDGGAPPPPSVREKEEGRKDISVGQNGTGGRTVLLREPQSEEGRERKHAGIKGL